MPEDSLFLRQTFEQVALLYILTRNYLYLSYLNDLAHITEAIPQTPHSCLHNITHLVLLVLVRGQRIKP